MHDRRKILHLLGHGALSLASARFLVGCGDSSSVNQDPQGKTFDALGSFQGNPSTFVSGGDEGASWATDTALADATGAPPPLQSIDWAFDSTTPSMPGYPGDKWWMHGNYGPVSDEIESFELTVQGSIPPELNGVFLRNSANPKSGDSSFWFMGDGMLHGVELSQGKALWYRNRWVQTDAVKKGGFLNDNMLSNRANTSVVRHGGRTLALYEMSKPFEINPFDLSTVGLHDYDGDLSGAMMAHPKIDPETGEMWFLSVSPLPAGIQYYAIDEMGFVTQKGSISVPNSTMMHDFQLTRNYVIVMDLPMVFSMGNIFGGLPYKWDPSVGARIGVIPRYGDDRTPRWVDIDPCFIFHTFNAYEDELGRIILEGSQLLPTHESSIVNATEAPRPMQWTIDFRNNKSSSSPLFDFGIDFPMIDRRRQGLEHRINYGLKFVDASSNYPSHPVAITKFDRKTGEFQEWTRGEAVQPDEAFFVPAPGATGEDEGWLLSMVYDRAENRSELVILEATDLAKGPIARIAMPRRVPFGFHGEWIPA